MKKARLDAGLAISASYLISRISVFIKPGFAAAMRI